MLSFRSSYLGGSVLVVCILTPGIRQRLFRTGWVWWATSLLLLVPLAIWQQMHAWPFLAHMKALEDTQLHHRKPWALLRDLPLLFLPGALLLFSSAFLFWFRQREFRLLRPALLIWGITALFLVVQHGKHYYLASPTIPLLVAGALVCSQIARSRKVLFNACMGLLMVVSLGLYPALVSLPEPWQSRYLYYARQTPGLQELFRWEDGNIHHMPQDMADKKGWDELAPIVQAAWDKLSPEERQHTVVFGDSYGEAGAANWYQKPDAGWTAISDNGSFSLWIKLPSRIDRLLYINVGDYGDLNELFDTITVVGSVQNRQARIYGSEVLLCTGPKADTDSVIRARMQEAKEGFMY